MVSKDYTVLVIETNQPTERDLKMATKIKNLPWKFYCAQTAFVFWSGAMITCIVIMYKGEVPW